MASDPNSPPFHDTVSEISNSPRVSEDLPAQPTPGPEATIDEIDLSPPYRTPAPYRSKLRPRVNTFPNRDVTLIEVKKRANQVKKRLEKNLKKASPSVSGVVQISSESLTWDDAGQGLTSPTSQSRLWSTSTQYSVAVSTPPSSSSLYIQPDTMDPNATAANDASSHATGDSRSTANSTATGETIRPSLPPPPAHQPGQLSTDENAVAPSDDANKGATPSSHSDRSTPPGDVPGPEDNARRWTTIAHAAIARAKAHIFPFRGKRLIIRAAEDVRVRAAKIIDDLLDASPHCSPATQDEIQTCITDVTEIVSNLSDISADGDGSIHSRHSSPSRSPSRSSEGSINALLFSRNRITYLLDRIDEESLVDVRRGGDITPEKIRSLFDTQVPVVRSVVKECMDRTSRYAALPGADTELIDKAQKQCQNAETWCDQVVSEYRAAQLHLESNVAAKEVTFKKFDPKGPVSVYQFLSSYEDWCHGYVSDTSKPRLLFTKYLHPSLTTSYEELKEKRHDYQQMKSWLIDKFGSVKAVADNHLRAIRALKTPKPTDDALTHATYVREMHRLLTTLYNLEIRRGVRVPQLQEYITSHTFLLQIGEVLPAKVKSDWTDLLAKDDTVVHKIEGERHLKQILDLLKKRYVSYELLAGISPCMPVEDKLTVRTLHAKRDSSPAPSVTSSCASCGHDAAYGAAAPPKEKPARRQDKQPNKQPQRTSSPKSDSKPKSKFGRWACPLKGHFSHKLVDCRLFFGLDIKERRKRAQWACITCFSTSGCKTECKNVASVPKDLLCPECGSADSSGKQTVNVLMCGVQNHTKPDEVDIIAALEKWIPGFKGSALTQPINVGFTLLMSGGTMKPPKSRSSRPDPSPKPMAYDTATGNLKPLSKNDTVIKKSSEESFYVMQILNIANEPVLTFFDTGSNAHLVDGAFAERAGFQVLDDSCTRIGVIGGEYIWSEYGVYSCILGPDVNDRYHEVECQGLAKITSAFPEFDLRPLHRETYRMLPSMWSERLPESVGGDRVKLLIGIRSSNLAPIQRFTLPSGLGVFQSSLPDIHGSSICFGGPHEVFTKGYARAGISANHLQVYFTEVARAYMRAPHTFISQLSVKRLTSPEDLSDEMSDSRSTILQYRPSFHHDCYPELQHDDEPVFWIPQATVEDACTRARLGPDLHNGATTVATVAYAPYEPYRTETETEPQDSRNCFVIVDAAPSGVPVSAPRASPRIDVLGYHPNCDLPASGLPVTRVTHPPHDDSQPTTACVGQPGRSDHLNHNALESSSTKHNSNCQSAPPYVVPLGGSGHSNWHAELELLQADNSGHQLTTAYAGPPGGSDHLQCHKALVPLSKLKGLLDEDDIQDVKEAKCDACANCPTCRLSARAKTKSLQESYEQEVIEKSVTIDLEQKKVFVDLPFIRPPADFLKRKHGRGDNFYQALRVYKAQCRKPDEVKRQLRDTQRDLQERGFMVPLSSLSAEEKNAIASAPFRHYFPWRAVYKANSVSTPVRMVVDPSATGLNIALAKGVNMLPLIPEILIRLRTYRDAWTTDISKLYNRLHLNSTSYPYSLFLFDDSLSDSVPPQVWLMTRAWYGVSSTGNQAGVALERLALIHEATYPRAVFPLTRDKYVDDIASGADTKVERDAQIQQTSECLATAGFSLKFVAKSGESPPDGASPDGISVGCLGLIWDTKADTMGLAHQPMNLNKKVRGQKAAPDRDLSTASELRRAFQDGLLSKAGLLSRIAEFYDPAGWWEPIKLQMKISFQELNPLSWDDQVPDNLIDTWVNHFVLIEATRPLRIPRSILPPETAPGSKIRLICLSDAAEGAGGTAIYGGVKLPDGNYSCTLLFAKSKLMSHSIPRNELEAIVLMAEASLSVRKALGDRVDSTFYYSDSTIAICWILNTARKLRMFVHNRVQLIRQCIREMVNGEERIPLFHIDGESNLADMITKPRKIQAQDVQHDSPWMTGLPWMRLPTDQLPQNQYGLPLRPEEQDLVSSELFPEVSIHLAQLEARDTLSRTPSVGQYIDYGSSYFTDNPHRPRRAWLHRHFDFIHLGWARAHARLTMVCRAVLLLLHRRHVGNSNAPGCAACDGRLETQAKALADSTIHVTASSEVSRSVGPRSLAKQFTQRGEIWYATQRLQKEGHLETQDLDFSCFYDAPSIKKVLPVVLVKSALFHAFLLDVHFSVLPHAGVEATLAWIKQHFFPVGHARRAISRLKESCSKCRLMLKRAVGIELADFHKSRTTIAPPFYYAMIDIAMGFKARPTKDSRKCFTVNALVIVCLLTSATSIHVIEGLTTQSVVMALERHSSRYGVPAHLFVDAGTQLEKLQDTSFSLRDIQCWSNSGRTFTVSVSTPKAHQQQGRVEVKIKILREMLQKFSDTCELCNTVLGWETLFAKISDHVDNLPIARGSASAAYDLGWEIITPNRLKLGRNNFRQLDGDIQLAGGPQNMLERNRALSERWYQLFVDRIPLLIPTPEKPQGSSLKKGDVVLFLFQDPGTPKMWTWKLGVVHEQRSRATYEIRYVLHPGSPAKYICRDLHHICLISGVDEIPPMSRLFYEKDEHTSIDAELSE